MITAYADVFAEKLARLEARVAGIRSATATSDEDARLAMREAEAERLRRVLRNIAEHGDAA